MSQLARWVYTCTYGLTIHIMSGNVFTPQKKDLTFLDSFKNYSIDICKHKSRLICYAGNRPKYNANSNCQMFGFAWTDLESHSLRVLIEDTVGSARVSNHLCGYLQSTMYILFGVFTLLRRVVLLVYVIWHFTSIRLLEICSWC